MGAPQQGTNKNKPKNQADGPSFLDPPAQKRAWTRQTSSLQTSPPPTNHPAAAEHGQHGQCSGRGNESHIQRDGVKRSVGAGAGKVNLPLRSGNHIWLEIPSEGKRLHAATHLKWFIESNNGGDWTDSNQASKIVHKRKCDALHVDDRASG